MSVSNGENLQELQPHRTHNREVGDLRLAGLEAMGKFKTDIGIPQVGRTRSPAPTGHRNVGSGGRPHHTHCLLLQCLRGPMESKPCHRPSVWECG